jgi:hypothetical protein
MEEITIEDIVNHLVSQGKMLPSHALEILYERDKEKQLELIRKWKNTTPQNQKSL